MNSGSYDRAITNNGTFSYNSTADQILSGNITGTGSLTKNNTSTLTLSGVANTYNGSTTVNRGTLQLAGNITSSALTLNSGGVISVGTNSTLTTVSKVNAASITINGGSGYAFTIGNVTSSVAGTDYDQLTATGALTLNNSVANPFTVYLNGTPAGWSNTGNYTWTIISAASQTGFSAGNFTLDFSSFGIAGSSRTGTWAFANPGGGGNITLAYSAPTVADAIWSGGSGNWNAGFTPSVATDANIFFDGAGGTATNNINDATLSSVNFITFNSTAGAYTLAANANSAGAATPLTVKGDIINNANSTQTISMNLALLSTSSGIMNAFNGNMSAQTSSSNITISGNISGAGGIIKQGNGSLTLSGANTYNGTTTITSGSLFVTSNTALGSTAAGTVINGGKLVLNSAGMNISENITIDTTTNSGDITTWANGTISGLITLRNSNGDIRNANSSTLTLTGGVTSALNRGLNFATSAIINTTPITIGTGALGFQGGANQLNVAGNTFGSLDLGWNGNLTLGVLNAITSTANVRFGGNILVNNAFTLSLNGTNQTVAGVFQNPSWAVTDGQNQNITGGGVLTVNQTSNATTSYGGRITDGATATSLVKNGNGTLLLQNWSGINSSYSGATTINAGTLMILAGNGTSLSSNSAYTVASGAALSVNGTSQGIGSLAGAGTVQNGNATTAVTLTTGLNNSNSTFSGVLQNGGAAALALTKNGTGTFTLTGNNTYSGATTINAGTLEIGSTGRLGGGSYAGAITNNGSLLYSGTNNQTLSGIISGTGALTTTASSTLTLTGANTYTGGTTVNAGTLSLANAGANGIIRGNLTINQGATVNASAANWSMGYGGNRSGAQYAGNSVSTININRGTLNFTDSNDSAGLTASSIVLTGGTIASTGTFGVYSSYSLNPTIQSLASANRTTISSGIGLRLMYGGTGSLTFDVANGTTSDGIDMYVSGGIVNSTSGGDGGGNIVKSGSGKLLLAGNNTYTGTTTINAGTIEIGAAGRLGGGSYAGAITNNATLIYSGTNNQTLSGVISGTGNLTQNASSTLTLSNNNTYSGATTINAGTIEIAAAGRLGGGAYSGNIANSGLLIYSGTNNQTLAGIISGNGALTQNNTGTLTLSGNNTYTGTTTINAGTLAIGANMTLGVLAGTGNLSLGNGFTLTTNTSTSNTFSGVVIGSGSLTKNGTGWLTLSGNNTYAGAPTVNAGTLTLGGNNSYAGTTTINAGTLEIGAAGRLGGGSYSGNIVTGSSSALLLNSGTNNQLLSGIISGSGGVAQNAASTLTLTGNNTYTGATTIYDGTLEIGAAGRLGGGTYAGAIDNSGVLIYSGTNNQTLSGTISSVGALTHNASSTLTLSGNNTYTGTTTINAGTIRLGSANGLGTGNITFAGGALQFGTGITEDVSARIKNSGSAIVIDTNSNNVTFTNDLDSTNTLGLTKTGAGTLTLTGNNTYSGSTSITTGTLEIATTGLLGGGNYSGNISNSGTLLVGTTSNQTLGGVISGSGALIKNGNKTLTLTGTSSFNGATTINGGTLVVNGSAANSAFTIASGGVLGGNGTVGALTVQSGGLVGPGNSPGNLGVSTLTLEGGGGYTWEISNVIGTAGTDWDFITVGGGTGAATINATSGNKFTIYISGNPANWDTTNSYNWNIMDWGAVTGFDANAFAVDTTGFTGTAPIGTWSLSNTGGYLNLAYSTGPPTWNGGTGNWSSGFSPSLTSGNMSIYFAGDSTATATNNIASATVGSVASITFNSTAGAFTLAANSGSAGYDAASAMILLGDIVNNSNSTQTINLALTSTAARVYNAATGNLVIGGPIGGLGGLTKNGSNALTLSGNNSYSGDTTINAGTLEIGAAGRLGGGSYSGAIANSGVLILSGTNNQTLSGAISGSGALTKNGSGTLTLTGNSTYAGTTTISTGVFEITTTGRLGGGNYTGNIANSGTFVYGGTNNQTLGGVISGTGALTKNASSTLTLSGNNTYTGDTTINAGTVTIGSTGRLGGGSYSGNIINSGTLVYGGAADQTLGGVISGSGDLSQNAAGLLTLTGVNTYTGATSISSGTLVLGGAGQLGSGNYSGSISNSGSFVYASSADQTLGGIISGTGALTKNGASTLTVTGVNSYSGDTTINAGTVTIGGAGQLGSGSYSGNIANSGTLVYASSADQTLGGIISGTGALTKNGASTLTVTGVNTYTGDTTINAGTVTIGGAGQLGSGSYSGNISNSGTLVYASSANQTLGGVISGSGGLTHDATSTLTLTGTSTYTGATTINAGTLTVGGNISSSTTTIGTGATLNGNGGVGAVTVNGVMDGTLTAGAITLNAGGLLTPNGDSTVGTMSGSSITINGGGYNWTLATVNSATAGTDYDQITSSGALTFNNTAANPFTIYINGTPSGWSNTGNYSWDILSAASQTGFNSGNLAVNFSNFGIASGDRTGLWNFTNASGGVIALTYSASTGDAIWNGVSGNWSDSYVANTRGFSGGVSTDKSLFFTGNGGTVTNDIASGTLASVNFITFNSTAGAYTLAANAGSAGASGGTALTVKGDIINNSSSAQTINMALALGGASTGIVNTAAGDITIGGVISGVGGLTKAGNSTLTLSAANTYAGATTINAGTLTVSGGSAIANTSAVTVGSGAVFNLGASETVGSIAGAGSVTLGANTLTAGGDNSSTTMSGVISGTGGLAKAGNGTLTLNGTNTYTGTTAINAGTLQIGNGGVLGALASSSAISNNGTLAFNRSDTVTQGTDFNSVISGTGSVVQAGNGTVVLNGTNTYTGATKINSGTLSISEITNGGVAGALGSSTNAAGNLILGGGTLLYTGANASTDRNFTLTAATTSVIDVSNAASTLTISGTSATGSGALTKNGSGNLLLSGQNLHTGATTVNAGTLSISGNISSSALTLNSGGIISAGSSTGVAKFNAGSITINGGSGYNWTLSNGGLGTVAGTDYDQISTAGALTLNNTELNPFTVYVYGNATGWDGSLNKTWNIMSAGSVTGFNAANFAIDLTNLGVAPENRSSGTWSFASSGGNITLSYALQTPDFYWSGVSGNWSDTYVANTTGFTPGIPETDKNIFFSGANGTSATVTNNVANSTLSSINSITFTSAAGAYTLNASAGSAGVSGGTAMTVKGDITNNSASAQTINMGLALSGFSTGIMNTAAGNITIGGRISGTGTLTKTGNATLLLSGNNTYTGATTISAGTLTVSGGSAIANTSAVSVASGAEFNLASSEAVGSIAGAGNVSLGSNTLTAGADNTSKTFSGVMSGTGGFTKSGSGTLTLTGNNTYTGTTTISAGTIMISAAGQLGGGSYSGNIANSGRLIYSGNNSQTFSGIISGTGALTKNGSSALTLSGANSYSGATTFNAGTLNINNATALGTGTFTIAGGTLDNTSGAAITLSNNNAQNWNGDFTFTGTKDLNLGTGAVAMNYSRVINVAAGNLTVGGVISGSNMGITKNGNGTLILSGNNSYTGTTTINAGTLSAAHAGALGSAVQVNGGTLLVSANSSINGMNITLNGTSTTVPTLSFNSNYNGTIGILTLSSNSIIDMGATYNIGADFADLVMGLTNEYTLKIYNWSGATLWGGGTGNDQDRIYFGGGALSAGELSRISFYSGFDSGFLGTGFDLGFQSGFANQIIPVPEPETWATGILLVLGGAFWFWRKRRNLITAKE